MADEEGRHRARQSKLGDDQELLTLLAEALPEGVVMLDHEHRVLRSNAAGEVLLREHGEFADNRLMAVGGWPTQILLGPPHGSPEREVELAGRSHGSMRVAGRRLPAGSVPGGVLVMREVSSKHLVEERSAHHARLAAVGELTAGVAHDFSNLLQGIAAVAEALRREPGLTARMREDVETIVEQTALGSRVTQQLLDLSRRSPVTRQPVELGGLLRQSCTVLSRAMPARIGLALEMPSESFQVLAAPVLIQNLVANLVLNARDAIPGDGRVVVGLGRINGNHSLVPATAGTANAGWLELRVADNGSGMPPEVRRRAFEPFFSTKARGQGTGLGLSQVADIVEEHEGRITLSSRRGEGTEVAILLPEYRAVRPR